MEDDSPPVFSVVSKARERGNRQSFSMSKHHCNMQTAMSIMAECDVLLFGRQVGKKVGS